MSNTNKTNQLYDQVMQLVDQSLAAVLKKDSATSSNQDMESAIASSRVLLEKMRDRTNKDIQELRELSEWDTFTIAFYGETNAGKSTLIETLRILLGDSDKLSTQQQFRDLAKDLRVDPENLASLELSIQKLQAQLADSQQHADQITQQLAGEERHQAASLDMLRATIEHKRKQLNFWQKLMRIFKKLDEEKALPEQELELVQLKARNRARLEAIATETGKIQAKLTAKTGEKVNVESAFARLVPLQDGSIIGNGRSDFTLQSHSYRFVAGGQQFQLIDVPGIEGDEKQVMNAIDSSVEKSPRGVLRDAQRHPARLRQRRTGRHYRQDQTSAGQADRSLGDLQQERHQPAGSARSDLDQPERCRRSGRHGQILGRFAGHRNLQGTCLRQRHARLSGGCHLSGSQQSPSQKP